MKLLFLSAIILFFSSCFSLNQKTRLYGRCGKGYLSCSQLLLKQDREFEYYVFLDVGGSKLVKGTWKCIDGDTLILNTFEQPHILKTYFEAIENAALNDDTVIIKLLNYKGPLVGELVYINDGEQEQLTDDKGSCAFKTKEIRNVVLYPEYSASIEKITMSNNKSNYIEIFTKDSETGVIPSTITNKLVVAKKKEIIFLPKNEDTISYKLKRTRLIKKQWK